MARGPSFSFRKNTFCFVYSLLYIQCVETEQCQSGTVTFPQVADLSHYGLGVRAGAAGRRLQWEASASLPPPCCRAGCCQAGEAVIVFQFSSRVRVRCREVHQRVQWLGLALSPEGAGSIPGQGTERSPRSCAAGHPLNNGNLLFVKYCNPYL